ncbi:DMSO/TMAO reductase YedYZ, molybdopterin-dependent catalytic subunit [Nocardioides scoriae]|uniref:DMSO/TMAO reductase YedYZ, molybdopterin-dependent catalytic subunit n=1 Tax=Nocardioides scoriae TaxID=642780 RepID=A0A1H1SZ84_9ACTN|nr:molybdopterin-dependent oxidoreductase [Nocardioides scoriae]SDS53315.1 DMSO/TMAO reductase YedYZ, molybdopterin-dependent catalytic subunit [Nocardioides scoriae]
MSPHSTTRGGRAAGAAAFGAGVLAALTGAAAGHLVAALTNPASSPVLAVGTAVINLTPTPVKTWAVRTLGSADKPVLIGTVLVVTLLLAGVAGVLARRTFGAGVALLMLLVAAAGAAAVLQPAAGPLDVLPALTTAVVGLAVLAQLTRAGTQAHATAQAGPGADPATDAPAPSRRGFLLGAGAAAAVAVVLGGAGQLIVRARERVTDIALPRPRRALPALAEGLDQRYDAITPFVTPNGDFYRVDTNLTVPTVDVEGWTLTIDGDVGKKVELTFEDLTRMDVVEKDITMTCVSNEVGGELVGSARWLGVPLADVLALAGIESTEADQILSTADDGFTISTPLEVALDGRDSLVVFGMNGQPLPREHGFPVRLITPGLYGYVGGTKWLTRLTLTTYAAQEAYWTKRKWATDAPIKLSSRIDTPAALTNLDAGQTVIGGVAWAQPDGVEQVEVRIDEGEWTTAKLGPDAGVDYWRQWFLPWDAQPGTHTIAVRATNTRGEVQTEKRATPFPAGSSGIQSVVVTVS